MIKNERQYRITKAQAEKFEQALRKLETQPAEAEKPHPLLGQAMKDALASQYDELRQQLDEYEALISGRRKVFEGNSFDELPEMLIKARIAAGLTQKELAERLGLKEQQLQRYEATEYQSASLSRLAEIARALGIKVRVSVRSKEAYRHNVASSHL
jgi:ribosome-binding protein aMBF1 (putative translation factor)